MTYCKQFPETTPKTLADTVEPNLKALYANHGIDLSKYPTWDDLNIQLSRSSRTDSVFEDSKFTHFVTKSPKRRVKAADSKSLALRAFFYNLYEVICKGEVTRIELPDHDFYIEYESDGDLLRRLGITVDESSSDLDYEEDFFDYEEDLFAEETKTLAETATRDEKTYYANLGIDLSKYTSWDELNDDIWATERESVFPEDSYQARVEYADSDLLALRAFIHNLYEHFTL